LYIYVIIICNLCNLNITLSISQLHLTLFDNLSHHVVQKFGPKKYYRFKKGGPPNYAKLNDLFTGTRATGQFRHASTMDPPNEDNVAVFDLNTVSPAVIDLTEPQRPPPRIHKNKGKRVASPTSNSPRSSKRGSKGEEMMVGLTNTFYQIRDQLQSTMIKSSTASSVGNVCSDTGRPRDWLIDAMTQINSLSGHMGLSTNSILRASTALKGTHEAKLFMCMSPAVQRAWLMSFVLPDDN